MTASFSISMEYFGRFQSRAHADAGFRMFQLFTTSSRRETNSKDRYQPNRRVVEHKGLLNGFLCLAAIWRFLNCHHVQQNDGSV